MSFQKASHDISAIENVAAPLLKPVRFHNPCSPTPKCFTQTRMTVNARPTCTLSSLSVRYYDYAVNQCSVFTTVKPNHQIYTETYKTLKLDAVDALFDIEVQ